MKKYLITALCLLCFTGGYTQSLPGEGTADSPYLISSAADLNNLRQYLAANSLGKHFRITQDIDLGPWLAENSPTAGWIAIGNSSANSFQGYLHGGGHTISGIWCQNTSSPFYVGLFGYLKSATVDSLGISTAKGKTLFSSNTMSYCGGIAGQADASVIAHCFADLSLQGGYLGGMAGYAINASTITHCYTTGTLRGAQYTGGMVGSARNNNTLVEYCLSNAEIAGAGNIGGIVGHLMNGTVTVRHCVAANPSVTGTVATSNKRVVGFVQAGTTAVIDKVYALAEMLLNGATVTDEATAPETTGNGQGIDRATLQTRSFYEALGWSFAAGATWGWTMVDNLSFPYAWALAVPVAIDGATIKSSATEVTGTVLAVEPGAKVWVKAGEAEPAEAVMTGHSWSFTVTTALAINERFTAWATATGKQAGPSASAVVTFAQGDGTDQSPYLIQTPGDLNGVRYFLSASFKLQNDLYLTDWIAHNPDASIQSGGWPAIGGNAAAQQFTGTFDGNHKTLSGLRINRTTAYNGLFAYIAATGGVKDLTVLCDLDTPVRGGQYLGLIAGYNLGTISGCYVSGDMLPTSSEAGGIAGHNKGTISHCYANCSIKGTGGQFGGIAGHANGSASLTATISHCYAQGIIAGGQNSGGIVGNANNYSGISHCAALQTSVKSTGTQRGRIAGNLAGTAVTLSGNIACDSMAVNGITVPPGHAEATANGKQGVSTSLADLQKESTYAALGWSFGSQAWVIWEDNSFPYFARQTAPPTLSTHLLAGITSLQGHYLPATGYKVWVKIDDAPAQEATLQNGTWSLNLPPLPLAARVVIWGTAEGKGDSYYQAFRAGFASGEGTAATPYIITTGDELHAVRHFPDACYRLANDIDLAAWCHTHGNEDLRTKGWLPLGDAVTPFTGVFDGQGHTLNLRINRPGIDDVGLFGKAEGATLKNLTVTLPETLSGGRYTGAVVGELANGTVDACHVRGNILARLGSAGGVVGSATATVVAHASFAGTIAVVGNNSNLGGIVGYSGSSLTVTDCYALADIGGYENIGGIVGYLNTGGHADSCFFAGILTGSSAIGGIFGQSSLNGGTATHNIATGIIAGGGSDYRGIGGIAGTGYPVVRVANNVAAQAYLFCSGTSGNIYRVAGRYSMDPPAQLSDNLAWEGMWVKTGLRTSTDPTSLDGQDADAATLHSLATYQALGYAVHKFDIWDGHSLPYPKGLAAPPTLAATDITNSTSQLTGLFNPAGAEKVWVQINARPAQEATLTGNAWSLAVQNIMPDDTLRIWTTAAGKAPSYPVFRLVGADKLAGKGTPQEPYIISTPMDLHLMRYAAQEKAHYAVVNNIDLTAFCDRFPTGWAAIGSVNMPFQGYVEGRGHTISGLWSDAPQGASCGLFAYADTLVINDLSLHIGNKGMRGTLSGGSDMSVGGMVSVATYAALSNCHVRGTIHIITQMGGTTSYIYTGGLIGTCAGGKISHCTFTGNITGGRVGGLVAYVRNLSGAKMEIDHCAVTGGRLTGISDMGGIAYYIAGAESVVKRSYVNADLESTGSSGSIGGIVETLQNGLVTECYMAGGITTRGTAGGIVAGNNAGTVCYNVSAAPYITAGGQAARITTGTRARIYGNYALETMPVQGQPVLATDSLRGEDRSRRQLFTPGPYADLHWDFSGTWAMCGMPVGFPYFTSQAALCLPSDTVRLAYGGTPETLQPSFLNIPAGETPVVKYRLSSGGRIASVNEAGLLTPVAAGIDTLRATLENSGYFVECLVEVTPTALTVTADNKEKVYGGPEPELTYAITAGALQAGDALSGALSRVNEQGYVPEVAGVHPIKQGTLHHRNYSIRFEEGRMTIHKRPISLTADNQEKVYGEADPTLTYQMTGGSLAPGEDLIDVIQFGQPARDPGESGGTYAIRQGSLEPVVNYALTFIDGRFTIHRAAQVVHLAAVPRQCADTDADILLQATSSAGLPLRFESSRPEVALVSETDGWVHINGAGTTVFTAYQDGNENYLPAQSEEQPFIVNLPAKTIKSKWNNELLVVDNRDGRFTSYQWHRNGQPIYGATEQSLLINGFVADYSVRLTTTAGNEPLETCPYRPVWPNTPTGTTGGLRAWPNPVQAHQPVTVTLTGGAHGGRQGVISVYVYDLEGQLRQTLRAVPGEPVSFPAPAHTGLYIITTEPLHAGGALKLIVQ
jgi:hypothetical protein